MQVPPVHGDTKGVNPEGTSLHTTIALGGQQNMSRAISSLITVITVVAVAVGSMSPASANEKATQYLDCVKVVEQNVDTQEGHSFTVNTWFGGLWQREGIGYGAGVSVATAKEYQATYKPSECDGVDLRKAYNYLYSVGEVSRGTASGSHKYIYSTDNNV